MSSAGKWKIQSSEPYPMWCRLFYDGKEVLHGVTHLELRDLQYVIARAILECRDKLPEHDKHEMD